MKILGLSYGFHDSAAALLVDGEIVAAVEEERITRRKHDASFPDRSADSCLAIGGLDAADIDLVAFHEKPVEVVDRHMKTRLRAGPRGLVALTWETPKVIRDQLTVPHHIDRWFRTRGATLPPVEYVEHHTSHAAAAYYPSPFDEAAVLTIDGVGEHATSSIGAGRSRRLRLEEELHFPDSVGLLYSAFTHYCGFRVNSGEGELMGLAPFGEPRYADVIREKLVVTHDDGSIRLDQRYFNYIKGRRMTNGRFHDLFGGAPRPRGSTPTRREADLAASVQVVLNEIVLAMAQHAFELSGARNLALGGGVALNCVANGKLLRDGPFDDLWVQPAAGDAGSALGAALWVWHEQLGNARTPTRPDGMSGAFLGPGFSEAEIEAWLEREAIPHTTVRDPDERCRLVADRLAGGAVVGWFTGRMEFGPRALGHRSILADPRSPSVQARLNGLVKERAAFRPFAPAVLAERVSEWFEHEGEAPYMNLAAQVRPEHLVETPAVLDDLEAEVAQVRSSIPAVTHVDQSARIQTVDEVRNPDFARLLRAFEARTSCPILLNTSFNTREEPVVCSPDHAYRTFRRSGLDVLVLEHCIVEADR